MQRRSPASKVAARRFPTFCREDAKWSNSGSWSEGAISVVDIRCRMCSYANKMVIWGRGGHSHRSTCSPQPTIGAFSAPAGQQQPLVSCPFRRRCDRQNGGSERRSIRRCPTRPRGRDTRGARGWRPPALAALEFLSPSPRGSRLRQRFLLITALKRYEPNVSVMCETAFLSYYDIRARWG